jgi:hypothetical protein
LATEPHLQPSGDKLHLNSATSVHFQSTESTSTDYKRLELPTEKLASDAQIPLQKYKEYEKLRQCDLSQTQQLNSNATNDSEMNKISDKEFLKNDYKNDQRN